MEFHEVATIFPLLEGEALDALVEDIRENGLQFPIELFEGKVLDGRNRQTACLMAGVEPDYVEVTPDDPVAYVLSLNLHRRHLTVSQASMVAARAREVYDKRAKERQKAGAKKGGGRFKRDAKGGEEPDDDKVPVNCPEPSKGDARDQAGKAFGISGASVDRASQVIRDGIPELVEAVDAGKLAVSKAVGIVEHDPETQKLLLSTVVSKKRYPSPKTNPGEPEKELPPGVSRGVGIERGHEAIGCLKRIPKNDGLRKRGFQLVSDWIKRNH